MLRAIIEGLDYQFLQVVRGFESGLGVRPERVVAIGGAIHNVFWMQNKADVLGRPIDVPALDEAVPLGAAILAGIGTGLYRDEKKAFCRIHKPGRTFLPNPQRAARYAQWFDNFAKIYPALKDLNAAINGAQKKM